MLLLFIDTLTVLQAALSNNTIILFHTGSLNRAILHAVAHSYVSAMLVKLLAGVAMIGLHLITLMKTHLHYCIEETRVAEICKALKWKEFMTSKHFRGRLRGQGRWEVGGFGGVWHVRNTGMEHLQTTDILCIMGQKQTQHVINLLMPHNSVISLLKTRRS